MGVAPHPRDGWSGRVVLVTGAAGFLGRAVSRQLVDAGAATTGLDIAWSDLPVGLQQDDLNRIDGDIRDSRLLGEVLRDLKTDTVVHLAAQTLVRPALLDPVSTFSHNIEGTWKLLDACRSAKSVEAIVVASSDKAYGDWSGRPYREDMALRARHPYDVSKAAADLLAQAYAATYDLPIAITRCGNLYGGGDLNWSRLVPETIRAVLEARPPAIRSDGTYVRDYLHVQDAAAAVVTLAAAVRVRTDLHGEAFNFASGVRKTVVEVVDRVLDLMGSDLRPDIQRRLLAEIPQQRVSARRARRELGWRPKVGFDAGLREAIGWYREHLAEIV
jgi:dTDP-D-glucose 4,6-dehydratase